jgi:hypothetical protein
MRNKIANETPAATLERSAGRSAGAVIHVSSLDVGLGNIVPASFGLAF